MFNHTLDFLGTSIVSTVKHIIALIERIAPIGLVAIRIELLGFLQIGKALLVERFLGLDVIIDGTGFGVDAVT